MRRLLLSVLVALFLVTPALAQGKPKGGGTASAVVATKPSFVCPKTELGDEALQARYSQIWEQYLEEVEQASRQLQTEIDEQTKLATASGNLDLALFWTGIAKEFQQRGQVKWDEASLKQEWANRFGNQPFPTKFGNAVKRATDSYLSATQSLEVGYGSLVTDLTKAGKLDEAVRVRGEIKGLLAEKASAPGMATASQRAEPRPEPKATTKPRTGQELAKSLRGTRWKNTNGFFFEWDNDGRLWHIHQNTPDNRAPMEVRYTSGTTCDFFFVLVNGRQKVVFDEDLKSFKQMSEDGKELLCTAIRVR